MDFGPFSYNYVIASSYTHLVITCGDVDNKVPQLHATQSEPLELD